uniref:Uncharacterized protein n=1 Tax=Timema tahoe TaxID=61484 RepID=A0A7R9IHN6_9NEOP|nr:unnamed protein product [Timema tahoe]
MESMLIHSQKLGQESRSYRNGEFGIVKRIKEFNPILALNVAKKREMVRPETRGYPGEVSV